MQRWHPFDRMMARRRPPYSRTLSLHDHILRAYLPYFATNHFHGDNDVDMILDSWLHSHASILDPSHHFPIREQDFRKALYHILDAIEYAENYGESAAEVSRRLLAELEEDWYDDLKLGGSRCRRKFRALAELSTASMSWPVGSVLRTFFLGWIYEIAEEEDTVSLAAWCWAIQRAYMDMRDKEECLRAVIALRPDVIDDLNVRGVSWLPRQLLNVPMVTWPRRRRDAGRLWWDNQNDRRARRMLEDQKFFDDLANRDRDKLTRLLLKSPSPRRRRVVSDYITPLDKVEGALGRPLDREFLNRSVSPPRALRRLMYDVIPDKD